MPGWRSVNSLFRTTAEGFADMGPAPRSPDLYSKLTFARVADAGDFWQWVRGKQGLMALLSACGNVTNNNFLVGGIVRFTQLRTRPDACAWPDFRQRYTGDDGRPAAVDPVCYPEWSPAAQPTRNRSGAEASPCTVEFHQMSGVGAAMGPDRIREEASPYP